MRRNSTGRQSSPLIFLLPSSLLSARTSSLSFLLLLIRSILIGRKSLFCILHVHTDSQTDRFSSSWRRGRSSSNKKGINRKTNNKYRIKRMQSSLQDHHQHNYLSNPRRKRRKESFIAIIRHEAKKERDIYTHTPPYTHPSTRSRDTAGILL